MIMNMQQHLINIAKKLVGKFPLTIKDNNAGGVAAALISSEGHIYSGICMNINCSLGFCAETAAIAEMLKHRETQIEMIVAIHYRKKQIITPCGRCRELLYQINPLNLNTKIITSSTETKPLRELLPNVWLSQI